MELNPLLARCITGRLRVRRSRAGGIWLLLAQFVAGACAGASCLPLVQHFDGSEIHAKGPVLSLAQTADGSLFAGSNQLAVFNGYRWEKIAVPGAYGFRALASSGEKNAGSPAPPRVWVGAIGAMGHLERDPTGAWRFTSLLDRVAAAGVANTGDVWSVHPTENGAVFVTTQHVLRWDGVRFEAWHLPANPRLQAFPGYAGRVWVFQPGVGLLRVERGHPPQLSRSAGSLPSAPVVWGLEGREIGASLEHMLVGTTDGVYRLTAAGYESLPGLSAAVRDNFPIGAVALDQDAVAIGTFKAGVIIGTRAGAVTTAINSASGLADDSVHALGIAPGGSLWIGLGSGLARSDGLGTASIFDRRLGLGLGAPRKVVRAGGRVFFVTEKDGFALSATESAGRPDRLVPVLPSQPLLRDAVDFGGRLWVGGFGGIWQIGETGATHEHHVSADVLQLCAVATAPHELLFTEGYQLKALVSTPYGWAPRDLDAKVNDTPVSLVEDAAGGIWVSTVREGITRFELMRETPGRPRLRVVTQYREGRGLPRSAVRPVLHVVGERLFAFTETEILTLDGSGTAFVRAPGAEDFVGLASVAAREAGRAYWIVRRRDLGEAAPPALARATMTRERVELTPLDAPGLETLGEVVRIDLKPEAAGATLWVSGSRGILSLDSSRLAPPNAGPRLFLQSVRSDGGAPRLLRPPAQAGFGPEATRIEFHFAAADASRGEPVFYQTRLEGVERGWSAPQREPAREFTGLAPGAYAFLARAVDRFGRASSPATYRFEIIAPWYRRAPALAGYVVAAGLGVTGLVWLRLRRLRAQTEKLNRLVAERTRHLELVNTAKSEFLENVSHEIRNPLAGIIGLAHLMNEQRLGPRERELAQSLKVSAEHLRRVSEEVLGFSKLEYGELTLEEKPFSLARLIDEIAGLYRLQAQPQGGTITVEWPADLVDGFVADEGKLRTIVGNFVSNASKYAPGRPIEIRVEWEPMDFARENAERASGANVIISVTDHGQGIPVEEQELIFQKFVRGSAAKQTQVAGTGIGLAACRVLARGLGGSVGVESKPGAGATFHLWLPLRHSPPPRVTSGDGLPREAGTALIVEDEDYNRIVLKGTAEQLGYRVELATDAAGALRLIDARPFDVVFLDWELPGAKGGSIAQHLRARPGGDQPVVLATTAHDSDEVRRRCRDAGMDDFLLKPFNAEQVRRQIAAVQSRRAAKQHSSVTNGSSASSHDALIPGGLNLSAFDLYDRGSGRRSGGLAPAVRFGAALDEESAVLARAVAELDREVIKETSHRIRALAALINARPLNAAARALEESALAASKPDLTRLHATLVSADRELRKNVSAESAP